VGNVMIDTLLRHKERALALDVMGRYGLDPGPKGQAQRRCPYALVTLHRPSNVDVPEVLAGILDALAEIQARLPILFPAHPRTVERIREFGFEGRLALWNTDSSAGLALSSDYSTGLAANEQRSRGARERRSNEITSAPLLLRTSWDGRAAERIVATLCKGSQIV